MKMKRRMLHENHEKAGLMHVRKTIHVFVFLILATVNSTFAQGKELAFSSGEKVTYGAYYNWHFIWVHAGEVKFSADTINYKQENYWHLQALGKTYKGYDFLYTVRDTFDSYLSYSDFNPVNFRRAINHSRKSSSHQYWFDYEQNKILSRIKRRKETVFEDTLDYSPGVFDLLSTAYYFRSFEFSNMKAGEHSRFKMLVDNKVESLFFTYLGKEEVKTREKEKFLCHKVSVMLLEGDFFPKGEHLTIWFTADKNIMPVIVETEITIGSVKAVLSGYENLKYPLTSKIENNGKR